jgi:hypothetical protein
MKQTKPHAIRRNSARRAATALALVAACSAMAAEYDCNVVRKVDRDREYTSEQIAQLKFGNRIEVTGAEAWVSRCSFAPSQGKVTCDRLKMDRVAVDTNVKVRKFYMFSSQFNLQLFPDLTYIENNGRGGISYGKCTLIAQ